jgi:hypothetical protein
MKWLTIDFIKQHSRIDICDDVELLELYGNSAEETVLNICNRSLEDLIEQYGEVPSPLYQAALMLVDIGYQHRTPASAQQMHAVPYAFDMMVKPYIKLT